MSSFLLVTFHIRCKRINVPPTKSQRNSKLLVSHYRKSLQTCSPVAFYGVRSSQPDTEEQGEFFFIFHGKGKLNLNL